MRLLCLLALLAPLITWARPENAGDDDELTIPALQMPIETANLSSAEAALGYMSPNPRSGLLESRQTFTCLNSGYFVCASESICSVSPFDSFSLNSVYEPVFY